MARYLGPKVKIVRRLGVLPGLTNKNLRLRKKSPGQHGKPVLNKNVRTSLSSDYKESLFEKQKLRYNYGLTEKQLASYYKKSKKQNESTGSALLYFLESRLDCILYRLGFAPTILAARQFITHRHILVNNFMVNIPSFLCKKGDIITVRDAKKSQLLISKFFEKKSKKLNIAPNHLKDVKIHKLEEKHLTRHFLPSHLKIEENPVQGVILSSLRRKNVSLQVNDRKVVEYYSR